MSIVAPHPTTDERELLDAACSGDAEAFGRLLEPRRSELRAHCYRMLGSLDDADDMLQEVWLRAWRGLRRFERRSSLRSWLYRIATNVCLSEIGKRPTRVLPVDRRPPADPHEQPDAPLPEGIWIGPYPDEALAVSDRRASPDVRYEQRESIELAFVAVLQHLPARQRAALILRDVLGFSAREVAEMLATTVTAVNSALQHARRSVEQRMPEPSQQATLRDLGDARLRDLVDAYAGALQRGDIDAMIGLLTEDATWSMPPLSIWYSGRDAVREFLVAWPLRTRWRHLPTRANGQLAVGCYAWEPERGAYVARVLDVLTLRGDRVAAVTAFIDAGLFPRFGLPGELPAA